MKNLIKFRFSEAKASAFQLMNLAYQLNPLPEEQLLKKIDKSFRFYPVKTQLHNEESNNLQNTYTQFFNYLSKRQDITYSDLIQIVNKQLLEKLKLVQKNLENQQLQIILLKSNKNMSSQPVIIENSQQIGVQEFSPILNNRGHLHVFGVQQDREKNQYFHQYIYKRIENELRFTARDNNLKQNVDNKSSKKTLDPKKQQLQEEMMKTFQQDNRSGLRKTVQSWANKFGYKYGEKKDEEFELPKIKEQLDQVKKQALQTINPNANFILVEDYIIESLYGIAIRDKNKKIIMQEQTNSNGLFQHYIRTEVQINAKDPPSITKARKRIITDIDGYMRGNPYCFIKRFDLD